MLKCSICEDKGYVSIAEEFSHYSYAERGVVRDWRYWDQGCTCERGKAWTEHQKNVAWAEALRYQRFVERYKKPYRTEKKLRDDWFNKGIRAYNDHRSDSWV